MEEKKITITEIKNGEATEEKGVAPVKKVKAESLGLSPQDVQKLIASKQTKKQ